MTRWYWHCARVRLAGVLAIGLAAMGHGPAATAADLLPDNSLFGLDLTWTAAFTPVPSVPADAPEPPPLLNLDGLPNQLLSMAAPSPGLQFTINPDDEEVFVGWQFEF